jgi:hypothetical protein
MRPNTFSRSWLQSIDSAIVMFNGWLITGSSRGLGAALIEVVLDHALLNL